MRKDMKARWRRRSRRRDLCKSECNSTAQIRLDLYDKGVVEYLSHTHTRTPTTLGETTSIEHANG